jgi:hypothetical protein
MNRRQTNIVVVIGLVITFAMDGWGIWIINHYPQYVVTNILLGCAAFFFSCSVIASCIYLWGRTNRGWK